MHLTAKQYEALHLIIKRNPDGTLLDIDQLKDRLTYKPTKAALQFTIRSLVKHKLIEKDNPVKRRAARRVVYRPTALGFAVNRV